MNIEEKLTQMGEMLGEEVDTCIFSAYLFQAKSLILNTRFPYGTQPADVEERYEQLQIELAIALYNERGAEGQSSHNENGVSRVWRKKEEIIKEIVPKCGVL